MQALRRRLRPVVVTALVAMASMVLLSAVMHAFAKVAGPGFAEVCTSTGMKWVDLNAGEPSPDDARMPFEDCPWCVPGAAVAPPPAPAAWLPPFEPAGSMLPLRFLEAPRTPHAWAAPRPRGPPALG